MRTLEEIKKEQDQALMALGFHVARVEQAKSKVFQLANEAQNASIDKPAESSDDIPSVP